MAYKLLHSNNAILRRADGASIPPDPSNRDYQEYLAFLDGGGVPEPADEPPPPPPPSEAEVAKVGVKAWFEAHTSASLLFNLSIAELDIELDDLVDDLFPLASAANKNRLKLWMKTVSHAIRALSKREGFT